ncbi:protein kinase C delta type-like [Engystomops pustulosus]|uniref:protein kinase C delta type-like n=1 Tax=Engystomops pustulosus TaxID=76066 RepID=UPI003AFAC487
MDLSVDLPRKRKGGKRDEAPRKKQRMETSKDGAKTKVASKRPGSLLMESTPNKRRREEMEKLSGTTPAVTPITVTGPDNFTFHKILGEGNFGKVMLATHRSCQQQLAVKMVKKRHLLGCMRENLLVERKVLEVVAKSPLFTQAHSIFHTQDFMFFVMEYISGGDLRDIILEHSPFPIPVTRFFAAEITCGLQFLHSRGIIHRDIKPDNILMDSAGHLKIADFGLAVMNVFGDQKISGFAGTLQYMAPEILLELPYNTAVDWFSAGVVFHLMATGQYPFYGGLDCYKLRESLIKDAPVYPEGLNIQVKHLIDGLLNKSPESRQVAVNRIRRHPFFTTMDWKDIEGAVACPPFQPPASLPSVQSPAMTSQKLDNVISSTEGKQYPIAESDQQLFRGITFANDGWQVVKPIEEPVKRPRTFGRIVRETFHRIWKRIKRWK